MNQYQNTIKLRYYMPFYDEIDFDAARVGGHFEKRVKNGEPTRLRVWSRLGFY